MTKKETPTPEKETTELALNSIEETRKGIPDMLTAINSEIKKIRGNMPISKKTDEVFPGYNVKIKDIKSVKTLISINAIINSREKVYQESAKELDISLTKYPFKIGKHSKKEWKNDIQFQLVQVTNKDRLTKLQEMKTLCEANLSKEDKLAKDMKRMKDLLGDIGE